MCTEWPHTLSYHTAQKCTVLYPVISPSSPGQESSRALSGAATHPPWEPTPWPWLCSYSGSLSKNRMKLLLPTVAATRGVCLMSTRGSLWKNSSRGAKGSGPGGALRCTGELHCCIPPPPPPSPLPPPPLDPVLAHTKAVPSSEHVPTRRGSPGEGLTQSRGSHGPPCGLPEPRGTAAVLLLLLLLELFLGFELKGNPKVEEEGVEGWGLSSARPTAWPSSPCCP